MSQQARPQHGGDAEVPILVHSSAQPTLVARDGYGDALPRQVEPLWSDKGFGLPGAGARPDTHFDPGTLHVPAAPGHLPQNLAHLVPQMPSGKPAAAANRLTRAQQSELEMARRRAQKAAQGKAANTASARRARCRTSDSDAANSDNELQQKLSTVTDEKEAKRLKRLLRNRVSAQQARERKKSYVATLEEKARLQEQRLAEAEQRIKTLERENIMLRSVMKNMQGDQAAAEDPGTVPTEAAVPIISSYPRSSAF